MAYNSFNSSYTNDTRANNPYSPYTRVPRQWLIFAQYLGTFFSIIGLIVYIFYMKRIYNSLSSNELANKAFVALLLSVIVYYVWRSIYTAFVIIRWAKRSTDEELCANRYIVSALSLGVSGFFTPFLLTSFPNVETSSTVNPRYFLSKTMGLCILIGAPILAFTYFITIFTGMNATVSIKDVFSVDSTMGIISIVILIISLLATILGAVTSGLFFSYQKHNTFDNNTSKLFKVISTTWMIIMTIELLFVIVFAFLRLLAAFIDFFKSGERGHGIFVMLLMLYRLMITISYVAMIIYITARTISGLWSIDGTITIPKYNHNSRTKEYVTTANA